MFLASKVVWSGLSITFLAAGLWVQNPPYSAAGSDSNKEGVSAFVVKNEITKMQETLRDKGHFHGKVDGILGLGTRDSIREYQQAENLPRTGQLDARTAVGLGVRPESTWVNSENCGREVGGESDTASGEIQKDKPSAGIRWAQGRTSKTRRKQASQAAAIEDNRGSGADKQSAVNQRCKQ